MSKMKYSGVEWIGDIPSEWNINKLKNVADIYTGNSISDDDKSLYEDPVDAYPYIATKDISLLDAIVNYDNSMYTKYKDKKFKIAYSGDTLLCIEGGSAGKKIAKIDCDVSFVNKLCCFHRKSINNTYLYYYLMSDSFREKFNQNIFGLIGGVSQFVLKQFNICVPNIFEQKLIADFLDKKVKELDEVLKDINKQIEILNNYKKLIITEKVTENHNYNIKVQNGKINLIFQDKFKKFRIKDVLIGITDGTHGTFDRVNDGEYLLSAKNVFENGLFISDNESMISTKDYNEIIKCGYPKKNDLLMCCVGTVGRTMIYKESKSYAFQRSILFLRCNNKVIPEFLNYTMNSNYMLEQEKILINKSAQDGLYQGTVKNMLLYLPSIDKQKQIVEYLDKKCKQIDKIIKDKQKQIQKIEEYKKSVIYEHVTGKKRVEGAEELYG